MAAVFRQRTGVSQYKTPKAGPTTGLHFPGAGALSRFSEGLVDVFPEGIITISASASASSPCALTAVPSARPDRAFRTYPAAEGALPSVFPRTGSSGDMKRAEPFGDHYRNGDGGHARPG